MHLCAFLALRSGFLVEGAMEMSPEGRWIDGGMSWQRSRSQNVKGFHTKLELQCYVQNMRKLIEACFKQECYFFKECNI